MSALEKSQNLPRFMMGGVFAFAMGFGCGPGTPKATIAQLTDWSLGSPYSVQAGGQAFANTIRIQGPDGCKSAAISYNLSNPAAGTIEQATGLVRPTQSVAGPVTATVTATIAVIKDACLGGSASYELVVTKTQPSTPVFGAWTLGNAVDGCVAKTTQNQISIAGPSSCIGAAISYTGSDSTLAAIDSETGVVTPQAGSVTVGMPRVFTVTATSAAISGFCNASSASYALTILPEITVRYAASAQTDSGIPPPATVCGNGVVSVSSQFDAETARGIFGGWAPTGDAGISYFPEDRFVVGEQNVELAPKWLVDADRKTYVAATAWNDGGMAAIAVGANGVSLFRSENGGETWQETALPDRPDINRIGSNSSGEIFVATTRTGPVLVSTDEGLRWREILAAETPSWIALAVSPGAEAIVVASPTKLRVSQDQGSTWSIQERLSMDGSWTGVAVGEGGVPVVATVEASPSNAGVYRSQSGALPLARLSGTDGSYSALGMSSDGRLIYAGARDGKLSTTSFNGRNENTSSFHQLPMGTAWTAISGSTPSNRFFAVASDANRAVLYWHQGSDPAWYPYSGAGIDEAAWTTVSAASDGSGAVAVGAANGFVWTSAANGSKFRPRAP